MKKLFLAVLVLLISSCNLIYLPGFNENIVNTTNPFDELGNVISLVPSTDPNNAILRGVMLSQLLTENPDETNYFYIFYDFSDSMFKPSDFPDHQPFIVGGFMDYYNLNYSNTNAMTHWFFHPDNLNGERNELQKSDFHDDVYYIKLAIKTNSISYANLTNTLTNTFQCRPANYLNTTIGKSAIPDPGSEWWSTIGYQDFGLANLNITLTNIDGVFRIKDYFPLINNGTIEGMITNAYYLTPDQKAVGFKVNGVYADWGLQTKGMDSTAVGTTIRMIWTNISTTQIPWNSSSIIPLWEGWPENMVATGDNLLLHTGGLTWDPTNARSVYVDPAQGKAVIDIVLEENISPGYAVKLAHKYDSGGNWLRPAEHVTHDVVLPEPLNGAITIYFNAEFNWTNI